MRDGCQYSPMMIPTRSMAKLQKKGKVIGGPCLDVLSNGYILETKTIEEMGEIFFNSPANFFLDREVHPIGSFADTLEGMKER